MTESDDQGTKVHIDETVRSIAQLRADHARQAGRLERIVDRFTDVLARPTSIIWLTALVVAWIGFNSLAAAVGVRPLDPPPFFWLDGSVSRVSLYLVIFILVRQRREEALAGRRELMALELALLSEQKTAKVIELLEEFRRDSPNLIDRVDPEADRMSVPSNPTSVATAISDTDAKLPESQRGDRLP
jgi:uncharacterized membrane protein